MPTYSEQFLLNIFTHCKRHQVHYCESHISVPKQAELAFYGNNGAFYWQDPNFTASRQILHVTSY